MAKTVQPRAAQDNTVDEARVRKAIGENVIRCQCGQHAQVGHVSAAESEGRRIALEFGQTRLQILVKRQRARDQPRCRRAGTMGK